MPKETVATLDARIRSSLASARRQLCQKRATVNRGQSRGWAGVVNSVSVGPAGQLLAALTVDNQPVRRGSRKPRLILPIGILDIGDEEKLT